MKQAIFVQFLATVAAGAPVVDRQQAEIDATALGQVWIQKIEGLASKEEGLESAVKAALINNLGKCYLSNAGVTDLEAIDYQIHCPTVKSDSKGGAAAAEAEALGQAWIATAERAIQNYESPQTKQKLLSSIAGCTVERVPGILIGSADDFSTFCPFVKGDKPHATVESGPTASASEEPSVETPAKKEFLAPASVMESDELCGPLSGHSAVDPQGTSEACVGTEVWCREGYYSMTSENFANADECINSRALDEDAIFFPYN